MINKLTHFSIWYKTHYERRLGGRYVCEKHLSPILSSYENMFEISILGSSKQSRNIAGVTIGRGNKKVLAWSQMHGNESTTTKALFDFFKLVAQKEYFQREIAAFLDTYTLHVIPLLNPDGAFVYTRENANGIDLNRDAQDLTQIESRVLRQYFELIEPDLCLNLHDQRTIYSLPQKKSATISFLAPAANTDRSVTPSRKEAMAAIVKMEQQLQMIIPGQIGRYDDSFNANCVGDTFQMAGVPTILFEGGHYLQDYERAHTREYLFYSLLSLFNFLEPTQEIDYKDYFNIPENKKYYRDIIIRNVIIEAKRVDIAIQYQEQLQQDGIYFEPIIDEIGDLSMYSGHKEIDANSAEILLNSHENVFENAKVSTLVNKNATNQVFFKDYCIKI